VLSAFLFEQERVANMFGVKPLHVEKRLAERLLEAIRASRPAHAPVPTFGPLDEARWNFE
jgi:hypothetical protein